MHIRYTLLASLLVVIAVLSSIAYKPYISGQDKINGVCFVAPPRPIQAEALSSIKQVNAGWVAITPYAFSRRDDPRVVFDHPNQWWGERTEGTIKQIEYAKQSGLSVMLKPHIWVMGDGWAGDFVLESEDQWQIWEDSYTKYILNFASIADSMSVEMLCIGTEYKRVVQKRPQFWSKLIKEVRKVYDGKITYAANWDNYHNVSFWDQLDFIGIDAYFPICNSTTPRVEELRTNWRETVETLEDFSQKYDRAILFTEYGYRSMDSCAGGHWDMDHQDTEPNMAAQKNAFEALYEVFWAKDWIAGGFLWKWYANHPMAGGPHDSHYTPQNKPVQELIRHWYSK